MTALSDYLENALANLVGKGVPFTALSTVYVGAHTAAGADEGSAAWRLTEIGAVGSYARVAVAAAGWTLGTGADNGVLTSNADITFPVATATWGLITHFSIWNGASLTTAELLFKEAMATSKQVNSGDGFKFIAGNLKWGFQ